MMTPNAARAARTAACFDEAGIDGIINSVLDQLGEIETLNDRMGDVGQEARNASALGLNQKLADLQLALEIRRQMSV